MDDNVPGGRKRMEGVAERLQERLVDDDGHSGDPEEVAGAVESAAETFADAPVQDFVPLLVEHEAADELRERGLHADLADVPDDGPAKRPDGEAESAPASAADIPMPPR